MGPLFVRSASQPAVVGRSDFHSYWSFIDTEIALGICGTVILVAVSALRCSLNTVPTATSWFSDQAMRFVEPGTLA